MPSVPTGRMSPPSPKSPIAPRRKPPVPHGFRAAPRPRQRPIAEMSVRELQDLHMLNVKILSTPGASTSTYVNRVLSEQAAVESRLVELVGVEAISSGLRDASIKGDEDMKVDAPQEPPVSRAIAAKQKALSSFGPRNGNTTPGTMSLQEAMRLEGEANMREKERLARVAEKKRRMGMPIKGEFLNRQEVEARIFAFMNHKPTESDLEDDDDDDSDDDPASWFEDDQDDGRKGQDIIEPDEEDLSDIIRVDYSRIQSTFYDPESRYAGD